MLNLRMLVELVIDIKDGLSLIHISSYSQLYVLESCANTFSALSLSFFDSGSTPIFTGARAGWKWNTVLTSGFSGVPISLSLIHI